MQALVPVAGWPCQLLADCWGTLRRQPPPATHISTMTRCVAHQSPLQDGLLRRLTATAKILWCQYGGERTHSAPSHRDGTMSALPPKADIPLFIPSPRRRGKAVQGNADCCRLIMGQLIGGGLPFLDFVVFG
jgi:hypothetical protein